MQMMTKLNALIVGSAIFTLALGMTGCGAEGDAETESLEALAELEGAQEVLGEADEKAGGCLVALAECFADDGEECMAAFKECAPKPGKKLAQKCKAKKGPKPGGEGGEADGKPAGDKPEKGDKPPKADGEDKPEKGDKPPKADGELADGNGKGKPGMCGPPKKLFGQCIGGLEACVDEGNPIKACVGDTKACFKEAMIKHFNKMCTNHLEKCLNSDAPAEACEKIAQKCVEGPKPPKKGPKGDKPEGDKPPKGEKPEKPEGEGPQ